MAEKLVNKAGLEEFASKVKEKAVFIDSEQSGSAPEGIIGTSDIQDGAVTTDKTNFKGSSLNTGSLEITQGTTPYIDFHYNGSTTDYSTRIINDTATTLNLVASGGVKINGRQAISYFGKLGPYSGTLPTNNSTSVGNITVPAGTYFVLVRVLIDTHASVETSTAAWLVVRQGSASGTDVVSAHFWGFGAQSPCGATIKTFSSSTTLYVIPHQDTSGGTYNNGEVIIFKIG